VQAAMGTVSTIPVIIFGYLIQKHLVRGLDLRRNCGERFQAYATCLSN
jgi:hypothetical protein